MKETTPNGEHRMKLTIFAATGGIGREIVAQAVNAGHNITAVVRNPRKLSASVRIVTAANSLFCSDH